MWLLTRGGLVLSLTAGLVLFAPGCGQGPTPPQAQSDTGKVKQQGSNGQGRQKKDKDEEAKHEGWWCDEHGVPESECSLCSKKAAAACKARGDWCAKHNRAKSQCFKCDPKLKEVFAARYRARYNGKE